MKNKFRLISFGMLLILFTLGCPQQEATVEDPVRPVKAVKVSDFEQFMRRNFPGRASATKELDLSFRVQGRLISLPVDVGDEVKKGDIVARLDPHDYEFNQQLVQGQLETGQATLKRAQSDYERVLRIQKSDPGAVSQTMIDRVLEARDRAKANIKSLEASLQVAKDNVRYTYLRAPWDGTVVKKYVENFEDVLAKQKTLRLINHSKIEFTIDVPEHLIVLTSYVTKLIVEFDPFPGREFPAKIKEIGKEASEITRTYPVTLIMEQPEDIKILPGMAGVATAESIPPDMLSEKGIEIPASAVFSSDENDKFYVWVIDDKTQTAQRREVKIGKLTAIGIRIQEGLKPGEWIATAGVHSLRTGQKVRILAEPGKEVSK